MPVPKTTQLISAPTKEIFEKSGCAKDPKEIAFMKQTLGNKAFETYICYKKGPEMAGGHKIFTQGATKKGLQYRSISSVR